MVIPSATGQSIWQPPPLLESAEPGDVADVVSQYVADNLSVNLQLAQYDARVIHTLITSAILQPGWETYMSLGELPLTMTLTFNDEFGPPIDELELLGPDDWNPGHSRHRLQLVNLTPQAVAAAALAIESQQYTDLATFPPLANEPDSAITYPSGSYRLCGRGHDTSHHDYPSPA